MSDEQILKLMDKLNNIDRQNGNSDVRIERQSPVAVLDCDSQKKEYGDSSLI